MACSSQQLRFLPQTNVLPPASRIIHTATSALLPPTSVVAPRPETVSPPPTAPQMFAGAWCSRQHRFCPPATRVGRAAGTPRSLRLRPTCHAEIASTSGARLPPPVPPGCAGSFKEQAQLCGRAALQLWFCCESYLWVARVFLFSPPARRPLCRAAVLGPRGTLHSRAV